MTLWFIRCLFLIISGVVGYYVGVLKQHPVLGTQIGCLSGLVLMFLEKQLRRVSVRGLTTMVFGLLLGLFMAKMLSDILSLLPLDSFVLSVTRVVLTLVFSYLGAMMALQGKDEFNLIIPYIRFKRQGTQGGVILLDTSAIIDGRVSEIYKLNFLAGSLVVPRFILEELQKLADSEDDIKRQRGRRGIELLRQMQNDPQIEIRIHENDSTAGQDVDAKLVSLAKLMDAKICTTDFNLGRVASLQEVEVLNMQELYNAVKSVVLPGERLDIKLTKEGKEFDQAVGYLEDGTMIVVSEARHFIGQKTKVMVTSILETQAGRMIFAKLDRG